MAYRVFVDESFFATVGTLKGVEVIRDHWAAHSQNVTYTEEDNVDPRVPDDDADVYAMAFMIGYLGEAPDALVDAFPDIEEWSYAPSFLTGSQARMWNRGYESGLSFFSAHALEED